MIVTLKIQGLQTLEQVRGLLEGAQPLGFGAPNRDTANDWISADWISAELLRFRYARLGKSDKSLVHRYLEKLIGLSRAQLMRVIQQFRDTGGMRDRRGRPTAPLPGRYTRADIHLLAEVDARQIWGHWSAIS